MFSFLILILPIFLLSIWAQSRLWSTYNQYNKIQSRRGLTGADAARVILDRAGISDVSVVEIPGRLSDHYDPLKKSLALSSGNFKGSSLAALGVSAHEAGHAIQHKVGYKALQLRSALVPITGFASSLLPFVIIGGLFLGSIGLAKLGVYCYLVLAVFQLITLPVEFNASARARKELLASGILEKEEVGGVVKTLNAAGLTYIAAFVATLANLIYLFLLTRD